MGKIYQMTTKYTKSPQHTYTYQMYGKFTTWTQNIPASSVARPSKIWIWDFWFENIPSGNPELKGGHQGEHIGQIFAY
jgi:hypothetical protein